MKIISYSLDENGKVPDYVIDGGYFSVSNQSKPPLDWTYVGIAANDAPESGFDDVNALVIYLNNIGAKTWKNTDGSNFDITQAAENMFNAIS